MLLSEPDDMVQLLADLVSIRSQHPFLDPVYNVRKSSTVGKVLDIERSAKHRDNMLLLRQ